MVLFDRVKYCIYFEKSLYTCFTQYKFLECTSGLTKCNDISMTVEDAVGTYLRVAARCDGGRRRGATEAPSRRTPLHSDAVESHLPVHVFYPVTMYSKGIYLILLGIQNQKNVKNRDMS